MDRPLSLVRIGFGQDTIRLGPFSIVPHADWRGAYDLGTLTNGESDQQQYNDVYLHVPWPARDLRAYFRHETDANPQSWFGSLTQQKQDASGLLYARNRYYDPVSGRFTQEDPIGLAGGLNLYGLGGGDPVTFTDPFGLCPRAWDCIKQFAVNQLHGFAAGVDPAAGPPAGGGLGWLVGRLNRPAFSGVLVR